MRDRKVKENVKIIYKDYRIQISKYKWISESENIGKKITHKTLKHFESKFSTLSCCLL